jgi:hypothetical protein
MTGIGAAGTQVLHRDELLLGDQRRVGGSPRDDPLIRAVPPHHRPVPEPGVVKWYMDDLEEPSTSSAATSRVPAGHAAEQTGFRAASRCQ